MLFATTPVHSLPSQVIINDAPGNKVIVTEPLISSEALPSIVTISEPLLIMVTGKPSPASTAAGNVIVVVPVTEKNLP